MVNAGKHAYYLDVFVFVEHRPRLYQGKENSKAACSYMIDTLPDSTPRYADEDPDDPLEHSDDYSDHG